jgi:hypothetical protein
MATAFLNHNRHYCTEVAKLHEVNLPNYAHKHVTYATNATKINGSQIIAVANKRGKFNFITPP